MELESWTLNKITVVRAAILRDVAEKNGYTIVDFIPGTDAADLEGDVDMNGFEGLSHAGNPKKITLPTGRSFMATNGVEMPAFTLEALKIFLRAPIMEDAIRSHEERRTIRLDIGKKVNLVDEMHAFFHNNKLSQNMISNAIGAALSLIRTVQEEGIHTERARLIVATEARWKTAQHVLSAKYAAMSNPEKKEFVKDLESIAFEVIGILQNRAHGGPKRVANSA
jgi:hypothetical protein